MRTFLSLLLTGVACWTATVANVASVRAGDLEFNRDIRPILAEHCLACHGPDKLGRKADLRLDQRESAVESGAIVPGKPNESSVVARIDSTDPEEMMPPPNKKRMPESQKALLRKWIAEGAEFQVHWAFIAPVKGQPPAVKNEGWIRNPIDRFVLARLEKNGLTPAPEADRRTLARRLSLDLTGLPPKPEEVEAFVGDKSPEAYERYVDGLLKSPAWGEHRGRYWLDAARYADTHGIHFDNYREMWAYRDWVLSAFNANMPFDRFTIEQLAGDLLPNATLDQTVASGFNRCNITTSEGGTIPEEYLVLYTRDRTETLGQVWLGLTINCTVCHEHKFDPISQKEFYELAAFFNNTTQPAMDGNRKDTPPILTVPFPGDRPRWEQLRQELPEARRQLEERKKSARGDFDHWLAGAAKIDVAAPSDGLCFQLACQEGQGSKLQAMVDGAPRELVLPGQVVWEPGQVSEQAVKVRPETQAQWAEVGDFERDQSWSCGLWVFLPNNQVTGSLLARMDDKNDYRGWDLWVEGGKVGTHIIHKWQDDALKVVTADPLQAGAWNHVLVTYDGSSKAAGVKIYVNGVVQDRRNVTADALKNSIKTHVPLSLAQRNTSSRLNDIRVQDVRLYRRVLTGGEVDRLSRGARAEWLARKPADRRSDAEKNELFDWWLPTVDKPYGELAARVAALTAEEQAIQSRGTITHVMQEKPEMPKAFVLFRGEYDKRRDEVQPDTPDILPPLPSDLPRNRLGVAQWLLRPEHPLTARVTVNRFWQEVFGVGIVRTAGDFGAAGELPSNQELLDYLAVDFRESQWDVKRFFKQVVMSATYRQVAAATPEKLEKDPQNRLLSRGPRYRMDAEMVRDYALAASDLLVRKIGGPSVKPYQPEGVWEAVAMIGSNTRDYRRDSGENLYRRSMYTFWKRSAPPASLEIFNAPNRETCAVRRERTNTPLQALVTLNDPQFVEAARVLAQRVLLEGGSSDAARIDLIAQRLLARSWTDQERPVVLQSLTDLSQYYAAHEDDARQLIAVGETKADASLSPATLAAWTMLVNELMNLDEVLTK